MLKINTKRLYLRIFRTSDVTEEYIKSLNSKEIIGLTESRYRKWNEAQVLEYIKKYSNKLWESLLIGIFKKSGKHIGNIRLHSFSKYNKRVEVGIMIWDKNEWGNDFATEALDGVVSYTFNKLKLHKVCAEYYSINKASAKIFQKLGFKIEGTFKDHFLVDGKFVDAIRVAKFSK